MRMANVMPAPGRRVRLADGSLVPASGRRVAVDLHVWRALAAGDLIEEGAGTAAAVRPPVQASPAPATASASAPAPPAAPPSAAAEEKSK